MGVFRVFSSAFFLFFGILLGAFAVAGGKEEAGRQDG